MLAKSLNGGSLSDYPSPLEALLPTLEERVTRLERDMEEQKRLRVGMDDDMSDFGQKLHAQGRLLKAIAKTQSEHTKTLAEHTRILTAHTRELHHLGEQVGGLREDFGTLKNRIERIIEMVGTLIERDRER
ncbi:hypothetical protein Q0Z83_075520 [Actinoplanes sichuanensis]|uniref:Uncharacterized protein n=1 Tax=Actinoplanes sichuanensis TaxID=512349 RepID=A0ABW4A9L8_9ACTN|nr:hypothetical protein [Actinoplanes sichuanensis]BEL09361.1 hypothetical protein Q0Z83_075520 [Actinoplanes sichuanensis]